MVVGTARAGLLRAETCWLGLDLPKTPATAALQRLRHTAVGRVFLVLPAILIDARSYASRRDDGSSVTTGDVRVRDFDYLSSSSGVLVNVFLLSVMDADECLD